VRQIFWVGAGDREENWVWRTSEAVSPPELEAGLNSRDDLLSVQSAVKTEARFL